jgi:hypothetical protein
VRVLRDILFTSIPAVVVLFLLLELVFRLLIPAREVSYTYYDEEERVVKHDVSGRHGKTEGLWTSGPLARDQGRWRVNNMGWPSQIDYSLDWGDRPLIALIGDSYVEALHVDSDKTMSAVLRRRLAKDFEVYSFGFSGASLCSYLHLSRYVAKHYNPEYLVICVEHNDFVETLCSEAKVHATWCLNVKDGRVQEIGPVPYERSRLNKLFRQSAFIRYLRYNLNVSQTMLTGLLAQYQNMLTGNINLEKTIALREEIEKAVDYVIGHIADENHDRRVIFLMDAPREDIYAGTLPKSKLMRLNRLLEATCKQYDVAYVDLTTTFEASYRQFGNRFERDTDWHWNETGHKCAAEALAGFLP